MSTKKERIAKAESDTDVEIVERAMRYLEQDRNVQVYINCLRLKMRLAGTKTMKWQVREAE